MSAIRVMLARLVASGVGAFCAWLTAKYGFNIDAETQGHITSAAVGLLLAAAMIPYGVVHKLLDRWLNPGDAASATLAGVEAGAHEQIKATGTSGFAGGKAYGGAVVDPARPYDPTGTTLGPPAATIRANDPRGGAL